MFLKEKDMAKEIKLAAALRNKDSKKLSKIELQKIVPAIIYGPGFANQQIEVKRVDFERAYNEAGESNLIELVIGEHASVKTLVKEVQRGVIKNNIIHIDFYQVDMKKEITTEIPLEFVGESKAVKDFGLTLVKVSDSVNVECLPGDLVDHIEVDISVLNTADDVIKISDLKIPAGMKLIGHNDDDIVANVVEATVEEEVPVAPEAEAAAPTADKDKKEAEAPKKE